MASETDQLAHDFKEVNTLLLRYPQIHVAETEGDPPAAYEVEYRLTGLIRQADGSIGPASRHLLRINLPFGYPHFPPTVKPLTPIFHPDIDPDAVRIASHWQQHPSLAKLIVHLGELICAKSYNPEEPFNQEAADWYNQHSKDFPLDEIQKGDPDPAMVPPTPIETVDATPSLEIEESQENIDGQLQEIQQHIERQEVVIADKLLTALSSSSPEAQRLEEIVSSALFERDKLLRELEELENEDKFNEAYEVFKKIREIAIDTPALSDIGQRLQQSQAMLDTFSLSDPTAAAQQAPTEKKRKKTKKKKAAQSSEKIKEKASLERKPARPSVEIPVKPIFIGLTLLAIAWGGTHFYINEADNVRNAELDWIEIKYERCENQKQFQEKGIKAEKILVTLNSVRIPFSDKKRLEAEIHDVLNSPLFRAGEAGDKEYKGIPLPITVIEKLEPVDNKIAKASSAVQRERFTEALALYQEALSLAEVAKPGALEPHAGAANPELNKRIQIINEKISDLQEKTKQAEKAKERQMAEEAYTQALELFNELEEKKADPSDMPGEVIASDQWEVCAQVLQNAQRRLKKHPAINLPERQEKLTQLQAYAKLYQELAVARQAYEEGQLASAITKYHDALRLLERNRSALDAIYKDALSKVQKTVVMLKVSLELRMAVEAENQNTLKTSLGHYKKILRVIRTSKVNMDDSLKQLEQYVRSKINEQSLKTAKSSNQEWWKKNYEKIFKKKFPASRNASLSKPRIYFIKVQNGRLLYTIRCTEKKGIRLTLELTYQYDLDTGKWSPYYGKL